MVSLFYFSFLILILGFDDEGSGDVFEKGGGWGFSMVLRGICVCAAVGGYLSSVLVIKAIYGILRV